MALEDASIWFGIFAVAFLALGSVTAAVALLSRQRARHLQEVREWGQRVIEAQDEERATIARDLHDGVIQDMHAARLGVLTSQDPEETNQQLVGAIDQLRSMARGLHPAAIDTRLLCEAIADLVPEAGGGPDIRFEQRGDEGDLPVHTRRHLYRIAQQALANAMTHARADTITISLDATGELVTLTVTDDGIGMAPVAGHRGLGMRSMAERAAAIGAALTVAHAVPHGTRVSVTVPRRAPSHDPSARDTP